MENPFLRIKANYRLLIECLEITVIKDILYQENVLNFYELDRLNSAKNRMENAETNRIFLDILMKKGKKAYDKFIKALYEAEYNYVAEILTETDMVSVKQEWGMDNIDKTSCYQYKINHIERQLENQMNEINKLTARLSSTESQSMYLKMQMSAINESIEKLGIKNESVRQYCIECSVCAQSVGSGNAEIMGMDREISNIESISRRIGQKIVSRVATMDGTIDAKDLEADDNEQTRVYEKSMKLSVNMFCQLYEPYFVQILSDTEIESASHGFEFLANTIDMVFQDGTPNWSRVCSIYAFGGWMTQKYDNPELSKYVGDFIGFYIHHKIGRWIKDTGGWPNFLTYSEKIPKIKTGLLTKKLIKVKSTISNTTHYYLPISYNVFTIDISKSMD
ncbi:Bcl-2-related protein A1 [Intoshia linei]|uniref:Bcl-2-related protein A1 n=1 Tax=Intoshia linei TaxID=1819745 RepID=A0A177BB25_9BILA|nr:Bcl-2-related protein A1 [Intoshia linei]